MKTEYQVKTPVTFLVFNRPDTTARVFAEIAKARPKKLLVVADGPRPGHSGDGERCAAVRSIIDKVDWDCEVLKNYSEINLGLKRRVSSGLHWVFGAEDRAIILEDDCVPHPTFFRFCDELLEKYEKDDRVGAICGTNMQDGIIRGQFSYYFSRYNHVWGWASWARAWKVYDVDMRLWPVIRDDGYLKSVVSDRASLRYFTAILQDIYEEKVDGWAFRWTFACWINSMLAVLPQVNLVSNIGFGLDATHTRDASSRDAERPTEPMRWPLIHPDFVMRNELADGYTDSNHFKTSPNDCDTCYYSKMRQVYGSVNRSLARFRRLAYLIGHGQFRAIFQKIGGLVGGTTRD